jgi:hypothetical protein
LEKWVYNGMTIYFLKDELFQINLLSKNYQTSFPIHIGDPLEKLQLIDNRPDNHFKRLGLIYLQLSTKMETPIPPPTQSAAIPFVN